jgi:hypothetical protein
MASGEWQINFSSGSAEVLSNSSRDLENLQLANSGRKF